MPDKSPLFLDYARLSRPVPDGDVSTHLGGSILSFFAFFPLGTVAIVYSIRCANAKTRGEVERAQYYGLRAASWGMAALVIWLLTLIGVLFVAAMR